MIRAAGPGTSDFNTIHVTGLPLSSNATPSAAVTVTFPLRISNVPARGGALAGKTMSFSGSDPNVVCGCVRNHSPAIVSQPASPLSDASRSCRNLVTSARYGSLGISALTLSGFDVSAGALPSGGPDRVQP